MLGLNVLNVQSKCHLHFAVSRTVLVLITRIISYIRDSVINYVISILRHVIWHNHVGLFTTSIFRDLISIVCIFVMFANDICVLKASYAIVLSSLISGIVRQIM